MTAGDLTDDAWLGGKLELLQPAKSYRVAIDAALLAAAVPLAPGGAALELGAGVGAATFALATRVPSGHVVGVELQEPLAALGQENVRRNGLAERAEILQGDVLKPAWPEGASDEVFFNPPYLKADANDASADPIKRVATVEGPATLPDWFAAARRACKPGGGVTVIHRADRLADLLAAAAANDIGGLTIMPLWPQSGAPARRLLLRGRAARGGRLTLAAGLTLHRPDGGFTAETNAILQGDAPLSWP